MAPKAIKDAKRPGATKKVHKATDSKAMQKHKANTRKVQKKPAQAQTQDSCSDMDDVIEENQEEEQQEEQQEEQEGDCQKDEDETADKEETKIDHKECYRLGESLPEAPRAVQKTVHKLKDHAKRSGKEKQFVDKAIALAMQKWGHKLFKSIDSLQQGRCQAQEDIVMPKVIMVAKCGGRAPFEQATCLVNFTMSHHDCFAFLACFFPFPLPRHWLMGRSKKWRTQRSPVDQVCSGLSCSRPLRRKVTRKKR